MTPQDRMEIAADAMKQFSADGIETIQDYSPEDLARLATETEIKPDQYGRLIGIMIYIRKRHIERLSRPLAFEAAFPERCISTGEELKGGAKKYDKQFIAAKAGEKISRSAIDIKAKRLENSQLYLKVYQLLQLNLYVNYAVERMKVLDEAFEKATSPHVADRDKPQFMKLFLEETRKPENAKGLEVNFNVTNNDVSIVSVEDRMNTIAQAVNHATAGEIIDMLQSGKDLGKGTDDE